MSVAQQSKILNTTTDPRCQSACREDSEHSVGSGSIGLRFHRFGQADTWQRVFQIRKLENSTRSHWGRCRKRDTRPLEHTRPEWMLEVFNAETIPGPRRRW